MKFLVLICVLSLNVAHADIICKREGLKITMQGVYERPDSSVIVESEGSESNVFNNLDLVWDRHSAGLITAPGLAITFANHFGCIKDAVVITDTRHGHAAGNIEAIHFDRCVNTQSPRCPK